MLRCLVIAILLGMGTCHAVAQPLDVPPPFQEGLQQVRNGKYHQALETSKALRSAFPQHPLAVLIAVEAYWGMIYCQTGHITPTEIRNVTDLKTSPYDNDFFQSAQSALQLSQQMRLKPESSAAGALYAGLAHAAMARLYALRAQSLKSVTEAKQMRADLMDAIAKDPDLAPDAFLGLGSYNYYTDALSSLLKVFRWVLGIPAGDRQQGLAELRTASEHAVLWNDEAKYELARIYAVMEYRYADALPLFKDLAERHPENPIYALFVSYQAEKVGQRSIAIEYCQRAADAAAKMEADCRERIMGVAKAALVRLQGSKCCA